MFPSQFNKARKTGDYFDWYAYAKLLQKWQDTLNRLILRLMDVSGNF